MSQNILIAIQEKLKYPPLQKMDANRRDTETSESIKEDHFSQSAIPSVLTALCQYCKTDAGIESIIENNSSSQWLTIVLGNKKQAVIGKIAGYSEETPSIVEDKLNAILNTAISNIKEMAGEGKDTQLIKLYLARQRNNILPYLPSALQMGELLDDSTLDDNTHKMGGPLSSIINALGNQFSDGQVTKESSL
ncbi:MAG: hypothetical protein IPP79_09905 [Chitinophagaceae bacterium]|nr:hypothetical protein [Chitinophagaceae bacterium]